MDREKNLAAFNPILDENGKPKVFYHGTNKEDFSQFKLPGRKGTGGNAIFVSEDPQTAAYFTHKAPRSRIYPVYVSANNLFDHTNPEHSGKLEQFIRKNFDKLFPGALFGVDSHVNLAAKGDYGILEDHDVVNWMKKQGHDGFYVKEGIGRPQNIALFNPSNIKSAISNTGEYDKTNPDITKSEGGSVDDDGITAYHGSPHDFDKFDISKIGTGEGAQSYGHGLYFAEAEPVARRYKEALSQGLPEVAYKGKKLPVYTGLGLEESGLKPEEYYASMFGASEDPAFARDSHIKYLESKKRLIPTRDDLPSSVKERALQGIDEQIADMMQFDPSHVEKLKKGHMYEVSINAHPDHFLDWDKPLKEQPHILQKLNDAMIGPYYDEEHLTGGDFFHILEKRLHPFKGRDRVRASSEIHAAGVPGIKYFDQGSRGAGEGSRNYVVFDDKLVSTKRKYAEGGEVTEYPLAEDHQDHLTYMSPDEFLDRARPLKDTEENKETVSTFKKGMEKGHKFDPLALYPDDQENGRHRAKAAKQLGIKKVPVHDYRKGKKKGGIVDRALMVISCQPKSSGDAR